MLKKQIDFYQKNYVILREEKDINLMNYKNEQKIKIGTQTMI